MKILLLLLLLIGFCANAQNPPMPPNLHGADSNLRVGSYNYGWLDNYMLGYKVQPSTLILVYFSGFFKGYNDVLDHHYVEFKRIHPNANDQWWNPKLSWTNKYKNHTSSQGAAFWKSTTLLVPVTDADHAASSLSKYCMIAAISIKIGEKGRPVKYYLCDALLYTICYNLGFWTTYEFIYRPPKK